jgi:hypothetical protein
MSQKATHIAQVIHRTCAGCGHVTHYDGSALTPEQLEALQSLSCEECGYSEAVIMIADHEPATPLMFAPLPVR